MLLMVLVLSVRVDTSFSTAGVMKRVGSRVRASARQKAVESVLHVPMDKYITTESAPRAQPDARNAVAQAFVLRASPDTICLVLSV